MTPKEQFEKELLEGGIPTVAVLAIMAAYDRTHVSDFYTRKMYAAKPNYSVTHTGTHRVK